LHSPFRFSRWVNRFPRPRSCVEIPVTGRSSYYIHASWLALVFLLLEPDSSLHLCTKFVGTQFVEELKIEIGNISAEFPNFSVVIRLSVDFVAPSTDLNILHQRHTSSTLVVCSSPRRNKPATRSAFRRTSALVPGALLESFQCSLRGERVTGLVL
jgi:hypothetical protein